MDEDNLKPLTGSRVISTLAEVYKQLYLCPGREGQAQYDDVVKRGRDVEKKSLSHFCMDERDRLEYLDTPAGSVLCVTLHEGAVGLICPLIRTEKKIDVMIARPNCQNNGLKREDKTVMD